MSSYGSSNLRDYTLTFVLNNLMQGGTQLATLQLINSLRSEGYACELVVIYPEEFDFFTPPVDIEVRRVFAGGVTPRYALGFFRRSAVGLFQLVHRLRHFRKLKGAIGFKSKQIIVAMEVHTGVLVHVAARRSRIPIVVSYRVHPSFARAPFWLTHAERLIARRNQTFITAQAKSIAEVLMSTLNPANPVTVIPNLVVPRSLTLEPAGNWIQFSCHSRFDHQKGIDVLLLAWSRACQNPGFRSGARLRIHGAGPSEKYTKLAQDLGISNTIDLLEPVLDIDVSLATTDVYVSSSRYEGFPNALAEAMSAGIPCLSTNCPGGTWDLSDEGRAVRLVEVDAVETLADEMVTLFRDADARRQLGECGKHTVSRFSVEEVRDQWLRLFQSGIGN